MTAAEGVGCAMQSNEAGIEMGGIRPVWVACRKSITSTQATEHKTAGANKAQGLLQLTARVVRRVSWLLVSYSPLGRY